jgi:hypothetical protein
LQDRARDLWRDAGAGKEAGAVTGVTLGTFGGFGLSLGVFGKVSVGDNKTLQGIAQTMLAKVAERITAEASVRAVYYFDDRDKLVSEIIDQLPKLTVPK